MKMPSLKYLSIRRKLLLLAMITSVGALLVTGAACMTFDVLTFRDKMTRDLRINAEIIGANCSAALAFGDATDARQTLASLRGDPHVVAACVYGPDGRIFASYRRPWSPATEFPAAASEDMTRFTSGSLEVFHVLQADGRPAGSICLRCDLGQLRDRILRYALILGGVLATAMVVGFLLAARLTRLIATPILHLADTARAVSAERNYAARAVKSTNDEVGLLTDSFNEMLSQIQHRDGELAAHRDHLEDQVARRTEELRRANAQLTAARDRAEAANQAKSSFLANMSHEIRTPMTAIIGYADMMLEPDQTLSDRQDCLQIIRRNARHLVDLINDILDLSKIEAERMTVERVRAPFPQLVLDVISLMRSRAAEKELELRMHFDGPIPEQILTDPTRLRQILMNLTSNAIKFTERGFVELVIRCRPAPEGSGRVEIAIRDTGIGMTPEQMSRLFQPFTQADDSMTRRFGGTGLGLVISRRLARLLGGDITVNAAAGVGSTFTLSLDGGPLDGVNMLEGLTETMLRPPQGIGSGGGASASAIAIPESAALPRVRGRILLAEDGLDNQRLISSQLRRAGAEVTIAENGRIAVDLVRKASFDVVVMDMQMPELDGYGAASELRRRGFDRPIIALTAHAMAEDRDKCIRAGCSHYLTKPIDKDLLMGTVAECLGRAGEQPANSDIASVATAPAPSGGIENSPAPAEGRLVSAYANDPHMSAVLSDFVAGLPAHVDRIRRLIDGNDLAELGRAVHQLKGAGGGYGFPQITDSARRAEDELKRGDARTMTEDLLGRVDELLNVIRTVSGYDPRGEQRPAHTANPAA